MFGICGRTLADGAVGNNIMDSRDIGMFWTVWEAFFGLRFKGELNGQGAL